MPRTAAPRSRSRGSPGAPARRSPRRAARSRRPAPGGSACAAARSPRPGTSICSFGSASSCLATPYSTLISSASLVGVRSAIAMSLVIRSPAIGITAVWRIAPSVKIATSVVPAPMSTIATPSSFSSSVSTASARGARVQHQPLDFQPAAAHALQDVLGRALRAGDDVHLDLEPAAAHADRLLHLVAVDDEFLRLDQQQPLVVRDVDRLGGLDHARHVDRRHFRCRARSPCRWSSGRGCGCR